MSKHKETGGLGKKQPRRPKKKPAVTKPLKKKKR